MSKTSSRLKAPLDHAHEPVQAEADKADRDDGQENVRVDKAVVFLPQKAAYTGSAGEHLRSDNDQPRQTEREPIAGENIGERSRHDDASESFHLRKLQHLADVEILGADTSYADRSVDHRRPHGADGNGKDSGRLRLLEDNQPQREPSQGRDGAQNLDDRIEGPMKNRRKSEKKSQGRSDENRQQKSFTHPDQA